VGAVAAGMIALGARRSRSLDTSGAIAGFVSGAAAAAAGWSWAALLLSLFVTASALSRLGAGKKEALLVPIVEKSSERDAWQVLANGGVFSAAAIGYVLQPASFWYAIGVGALAASTADTWATEVGTLSSSEPVSIVSGREVSAGTSGGITALGSLAGIAGALFIAAIATLARWPVPFAAAALGGITGTLADSVLGATVQSRRWCDRCDKATERRIHSCNTPTRHAGGIRGMNNDAVNVVCSCIGALVALLMAQ
jgi:uncharacterized protein (TIGR00297 family)